MVNTGSWDQQQKFRRSKPHAHDQARWMSPVGEAGTAASGKNIVVSALIEST